MTLNSLAVGVSSDQLGKIVPVFNMAGIATEVYPESHAAWDRLAHFRYDAALLDCKYAYGWRDALPGIRRNPSNRHSVIFAILDETTSAAELSQCGTSFVLDRGFSQDALLRNVRAVHGFMLAHKQRQHRYELLVPVMLSSDVLPETEAISKNISFGGMCLRARLPLAPKARLEARFQLPGSVLISTEAEVVWQDASLNTGLRFTRISQRTQDRLASWLKEEWMKTCSSLTKLPLAVPQHLRDSGSGRQLLCNAFIKQLPVEWRCSQCYWRYSIRVEASSPQYAFGPPEYVSEAFNFHSCSQDQSL